jgi:hypothetical protein
MGHPLTPDNLRINRSVERWLACNAGATALRHFGVDMIALREILHDRTVWRAGANEQRRDYRFRPDSAGAGSYGFGGRTQEYPYHNR